MSQRNDKYKQYKHFSDEHNLQQGLTFEELQYERFLDELNLNHGLTFEELKRQLECFCNADIILEPKTLPDSISGLSFRSESGPYIIFYDQFRTGRALIRPIYHEFSHIIRGDADKKSPIAKCKVEAALSSVHQLRQLEGLICGRFKFGQDIENEKAVERNGNRLMTKIASRAALELDSSIRTWWQI